LWAGNIPDRDYCYSANGQETMLPVAANAGLHYRWPMILRRLQIGVGTCAVMVVWASIYLSAPAQNHGSDEFRALMKQGFELHQRARFGEAIPILDRARRLAPEDYFANLLLGIDLLRSGMAAESVPRLEMAARTKPNEEFPEEYLGEANADLGRYGLAAEAYQRAVLRGHNSEQALEAWAGFALERFHQIGEGLRATQEGVAVAQRLQEAAAHPNQTSGCAASLVSLEHKLAVKQAHVDAGSAYQLSICYALEAGRAAERLQAGAQDMAVVHRLRGDVFLRLKGDAVAAEGEYRQALATRPNDPRLLESLAEAQLSAGETTAAQESARASLAVDPHRREALRTLAALAMSDRNYDQALPWLRQLVAEAPGDLTAAVELAKALAQTGESAESLQRLAPALAAGYPDEKGALHAMMARMLRKLGRDGEALAAETEARRLSDAYQMRSRDSAPANPDADQ
jgi:predicted Zn-dependent protease